jgi:hypothetical protein
LKGRLFGRLSFDFSIISYSVAEEFIYPSNVSNNEACKWADRKVEEA